MKLSQAALFATIATSLAACATRGTWSTKAATPHNTPHAAPAASTQTSTEKKDAEETRKYMWRVGGWITLAVAAGAGVVAIGTSYLMIHNASVRSSHCDANRTCDQTGIAANQMIDSLSGWNLGAWVVAVTGAAVGAYILVTHPDGRKDKGTTAIGVSPNGSGLGLELRRTF
jgi:hypothetical protein